MDIKENIKSLIYEASISQNINIDINQIEIEVPKENINGDLSTNISMKLARDLKMNPMDIANKIKEKIVDKEKIEKIEVVKPGFMNFFLNRNYIFSKLKDIIDKKEDYGKNIIGNGKSINIEFVSANPTGIIHLGTARGAAYGSSLSKIMEFCGYKVTREYYINDAGNQIVNLGKSIYERYKGLLGLEESMPEDGYYGKEIIDIAKKIYSEYNKEKLEENIEFFKNTGVNELLSRLKKDLSDFRVEFDIWSSEKEIIRAKKEEECLKILRNKGLIYKKEGAEFLETTKYGDDKDRVIVKSDGAYTYLVPDIAYHLDKINRGYDELIDVLGADHHGYISRLKASIIALGQNSDKITIKLVQMVKLIKDGEEVKMSKRTGKTITLSELMEEIGVDAARFFYLNRSVEGHMDLDIDIAKKKSNENPLFYIQYAHARICSIINEADALGIKYDTNIKFLNNDNEYHLLTKVLEFGDVVKSSALKKEPNALTTYLYELATLFHSYYTKEKVITEDKKLTSEKLALIKGVQITIKNGLNLLLIDVPEKM